MEKILNKIADVIKFVFGYGIMICLLVGGLSFFGYFVALCIGGSAAEIICVVIYEHIYPALVILSTSMIALGLIKMYISGETNIKKKNKSENVPKKI